LNKYPAVLQKVSDKQLGIRIHKRTRHEYKKGYVKAHDCKTTLTITRNSKLIHYDLKPSFSKGAFGAVHRYKKVSTQGNMHLFFRTPKKVIKRINRTKYYAPQNLKENLLKENLRHEVRLVYLAQGEKLTLEQIDKKIVIKKEYCYIIIPDYGNGDLQRLIEKNNSPSLRKSKTQLKIMRDLMLALLRIHKSKKAHWDVKMENIIIQNDRAFLIDPATQSQFKYSGGRYGTAIYEHPETRLPIPPHACDIFALGMNLYELVAYSRSDKALLAVLKKAPLSNNEEILKMADALQKHKFKTESTVSKIITKHIVRMLKEPENYNLWKAYQEIEACLNRLETSIVYAEEDSGYPDEPKSEIEACLNRPETSIVSAEEDSSYPDEPKSECCTIF